MHQVITRSDTSIPANCYACRLWRPLLCHKWVWLKWYLSTMGWRWTASITAMSCCLSRCFQQSNVSQNVVYSQNNMMLTAKLVIFLCSVISQGKVVALDRWGGKWNHLSMPHRLATNYAKNYCNRTPIVKVIVENVVTCFLGGHSVESCTEITGVLIPSQHIPQQKILKLISQSLILTNWHHNCLVLIIFPGVSTLCLKKCTNFETV